VKATNDKKATRRKRLSLATGLAISGISLYLAFKDVNPGDVRIAFEQAHWGLVTLALVSVIANQAFKIWRWKLMFVPPAAPVSTQRIANALLAGQMINFFTPVRLGEVSRVYYIGDSGSGHSFVLGTVVIEKTLDMGAYAMLLIIALGLIPLPGWLRGPLAPILWVALAAVGFLVLAAGQRRRLSSWLEPLTARLPTRARAFSSRHLENGLSSLEMLQHPGSLAGLVTLTALVWITAILVNYLIMLAIGLYLPLSAAVLLLIVLQAGISLPSLPGTLGVFELICVWVLAIFGVERSLALSYGILLHVVVFFPLLFTGILSLWTLELERGSSSSEPPPS
jgi:glycosyltransferase 2 family protein